MDRFDKLQGLLTELQENREDLKKEIRSYDKGCCHPALRFSLPLTPVCLCGVWIVRWRNQLPALRVEESVLHS